MKGYVSEVASIERTWARANVNTNNGALWHLGDKSLREVAIAAANF